MTRRDKRTLGLATAALGLSVGFAPAQLSAAAIPVTNYSFESPVVNTTFLPVSLTVDGWSTAGPSQDVDVGDGNGPRNSGTGSFPNPAPGPTRFTNADGNQLAYIFTSTGEEFYQTLTSNFTLNPAGSNVYSVKAGVGNASGAPAPTDQLLLRLFYTNAGDLPSDPTKRVFVATRVVQNNATDALSGTVLKDFSGSTVPLLAGNPAIGRPINVLITSVGAGGTQFDFDNVRVDAVPEPASAGLAIVAGVGLLARRRRRTGYVGPR